MAPAELAEEGPDRAAIREVLIVDDTTTSAVGTEAEQPREEIPPIEPRDGAPVETAPAD